MEGMIEVFCRNTDRRFLVPCGADLKEVLKYSQLENEENILGALVNNKVQSMNYKIYTPREVAFFDYNSSFGKRMYALSLMFVLYKATKEVFPQYEICIQHSMNDGYYVEFENSGVDVAEVLPVILEKMKERLGVEVVYVVYCKYFDEYAMRETKVEDFRIGRKEDDRFLSLSINGTYISRIERIFKNKQDAQEYLDNLNINSIEKHINKLKEEIDKINPIKVMQELEDKRKSLMEKYESESKRLAEIIGRQPTSSGGLSNG